MKTLIAAALAAVFSIAGAAQAADVYHPGGAYTPDRESPPTRPWTGVYFGGWASCKSGGHDVSVSYSDLSAEVDGVSFQGCSIAPQVGFDLQLGRYWVVGLGGDFEFNSAETTVRLGDLRGKVEAGNAWTAHGRAGYLVAPGTLWYGLIGYGQAEFEAPGLGDATFDVWTFGTGVEHRILDGTASIKLEYRHQEGQEKTLFSGDGLVVKDGISSDAGLVGVVYRLN